MFGRSPTGSGQQHPERPRLPGMNSESAVRAEVEHHCSRRGSREVAITRLVAGVGA